jgi:hypothetical protein
VDDAVTLDLIEQDREAAVAAMVPLSAMLPQLPSVILTREGATHAIQGRNLGPKDIASQRASGTTRHALSEGSDVEDVVEDLVEEWIRLLTADGELLGLARPTVSDLLHPSLVLR